VPATGSSKRTVRPRDPCVARHHIQQLATTALLLLLLLLLRRRTFCSTLRFG